MTHQSGHLILKFMEAPVGGKKSPVKRRDILCLLIGLAIGWLIWA